MADPIQTTPYKRLNNDTLDDLGIPRAAGHPINSELARGYDQGIEAVETLLRRNPNRLNELSNWNNPETSLPEMERKRGAFVDDAVAAALVTHPLRPDAALNAWLGGLGHPDPLRGVRDFKSDFKTNIKRGVEAQLKDSLDDHRKNNFDNRLTTDVENVNRTIRAASGLTNSAEWISRGKALCQKLAPDEVKKLDLKLTPAEQTLTGRSYEFVVRNAIMATSTVAAFGVAAYSFATPGIEQPFLVTGIAMAVNAGITFLLRIRHDSRIEQLVANSKELAEKATSMPAAILWCGVLSHVLEKFNPITLFRRDKCKSFGNTSETTVSATQARLRDVAKTALAQLDPKANKDSPSSYEWLHRDGKVNDALRQVESNVNELIGRWNTIPHLTSYIGIASASISLIPAIGSILKHLQ